MAGMLNLKHWNLNVITVMKLSSMKKNHSANKRFKSDAGRVRWKACGQ